MNAQPINNNTGDIVSALIDGLQFGALDIMYARTSGTNPPVALIGLRAGAPGALGGAELAAWLRACADDIERTAEPTADTKQGGGGS